MSLQISPTDIGIIVLAAGNSRRFGDDKRIAVLSDGRSVLESTLSSIPDTFTRKILVLKKGDELLASKFKQDWQICIADAPETGMANSLGNALKLTGGWAGALIALADMPFISAQSYSAIQNALTSHTIVVPVHQGRRGNPVAFRKTFFPEIRRLTGDQGAKSLLKKYRAEIYELTIGDEGIFRDIDIPEMIT